MSNVSLAKPVATRAGSQRRDAGTVQRWWQYQRERFPLVSHGPLIAAFSISTVSYSTMLRTSVQGALAALAPKSIAVAFLTCLLFFVQLRIIDEFKDFDEDCRYRPYRPVPRGLISLNELRLLLIASAAIQAGLAVWLKPWLILLLVVAWGYLCLSAKDFFLGKWITERPLTNMATHMMIMPVVDLYASACDWGVGASRPPSELGWFLMVSFFNGFVFEIGRKIRAPEDEETGVATYSVLWGPRTAVSAWCLATVVTGCLALVAAYQIGFTVAATTLLAIMCMAAGAVALRYFRQPIRQRARMIEAMSAFWTLGLYMSLGLLPRLMTE